MLDGILDLVWVVEERLDLERLVPGVGAQAEGRGRHDLAEPARWVVVVVLHDRILFAPVVALVRLHRRVEDWPQHIVPLDLVELVAPSRRACVHSREHLAQGDAGRDLRIAHTVRDRTRLVLELCGAVVHLKHRLGLRVSACASGDADGKEHAALLAVQVACVDLVSEALDQPHAQLPIGSAVGGGARGALEILMPFLTSTSVNQSRMATPVCSVSGKTSKSRHSLTARSCSGFLSFLGVPVLPAVNVILGSCTVTQLTPPYAT
eukprot:5643152-Prymnesium_polylepis.1